MATCLILVRQAFSILLNMGIEPGEVQKILRKYSLNKVAARPHYLDVQRQTPRYSPLSMKSLAVLDNMRHPAAINPVSTNTLYKLRMSPKIPPNSLHNRLKKYFP